MTALISDGNDSVFDTSHIIDFDPADFGLPPGKHASFDGRGIHPDSRADAANASYDETSTSTASTRSDTSGASAPVPGNSRTRQTSMASLTNGTPVHSGLPTGKNSFENDFALVDRTVRPVRGLSDHTITAVEDDDVPPEPTAAPPPPPPSSLPPQVPHHHTQQPILDALDDAVQPLEPVGPPPPPPSSFPPPPPTSTVTPATPTTPLPPSRSLDAPRLSPPHSLPSTSTPALAAQGANQVRQRHTLEVPRKQQRGSRDSVDAPAAFTSGRFSPTTAGPTATPSTRRASLSIGRRNTRSMQSDLPRDEVAPDEDAMRWAEAYRQKRASKKRRREEEDDDRVLVGTKVDEHHVNWVTAYNMLTGIRVSVSRTNAKLDREVTEADFDVKQKSTFDM